MRSLTYSHHHRNDFADFQTAFLVIAALFIVCTTIAVYAYAAMG